MEELKLINKFLLDKFGRDNEQQRYRLVLGDEQYEYRHGNFAIFSPGGVFLRDEDNVTKLVEKYAYLPKGTWILEKVCPVTSDEIRGATFTYEPVYCFVDNKTEKALPRPTLKAIDFLMSFVTLEKKKRTAADDFEEDRQAFYKEVEANKEELGLEYIPSMLANREAVVNAADKKIFVEE